MRYKLLFIFLLTTSFCVLGKNGILFEKDSSLSNALIKAKQENKLIFLDCYAQWCEPCQKLSKNVFTKDSVGDFFNSRFINLTVDVSSNNWNDLMTRYMIKAFPTLLFLNYNGDIVFAHLGGVNEITLIKIAENALKNISFTDSIKTLIKSGNRSYSVVSEYLNKVPLALNRDSILLDYFNSIEISRWSDSTSWDLIKRYIEDIHCKPFLFLIENKKLFETKYSKGAVESKLLSVFSNCIYYSTNFDSIFHDLKQIDSLILISALTKNMGCEMCVTRTLPQWNCFKEKTNYILQKKLVIDNEILYRMSYFIVKHYRQYNDTAALLLANEVGAELLNKQFDNPDFNDINAEIYFNLGNLDKAVKFEELAIKYAIQNKNEHRLGYFNKMLEIYKKSSAPNK